MRGVNVVWCSFIYFNDHQETDAREGTNKVMTEVASGLFLHCQLNIVDPHSNILKEKVLPLPPTTPSPPSLQSTLIAVSHAATHPVCDTNWLHFFAIQK